MARKRTRGISRALVITPKGYAILRAVERGTYKFGGMGRPKKRRGRR